MDSNRSKSFFHATLALADALFLLFLQKCMFCRDSVNHGIAEQILNRISTETEQWKEITENLLSVSPRATATE